MSNGYIYCVSTPANNDRCKVGETLKGIEHRLKGLNTTSVSENFKLDYYIIVDPKKRFNIETSIHNDIINAGYTRFTGKEFFKCNPSDIKHIFEKYGNIYTTINEHKNIEVFDDIKEPNNKIKNKKCYKCNICKKEFFIKRLYNNHLNRINPCKEFINIENKCINCNKIYSTRSNLNKHIKNCIKDTKKIITINNQFVTDEIKKIILAQEKKINELVEINKYIISKLLA